jgi:hypothetical protein
MSLPCENKKEIKMKDRMLVYLVLVVACLQASAQSLSNGKGDLRVMTYNVNEGTDFLEIQAATDTPTFLAAVVQTITQVRATNPPARMQALAKQIIAASPDLVGLQELDQWSTGPLDPFTFTCGTMTTEFDMLKELQDALVAQGCSLQVRGSAETIHVFADTWCNTAERPFPVRAGRGRNRHPGAHRFGSLKVPGEQPTVSTVCEHVDLSGAWTTGAVPAGLGLRGRYLPRTSFPLYHHSP